MARATPTKSWLWHQRLSHLNFDTINDLAKNDLVFGLPKFKYAKEHLCHSFEQGKSKRASRPLKPVLNSKQRLICFIWICVVQCELLALMANVIKNFLKKISVRLQAPVIIVRTDNETEFKNYVLKEYFNSVGITHETSAAITPQQNGFVERRNCTLVEAARTMLIFFHALLFLWAEAIATVCYTQNRSIIHRRFNKTPYELIQGRKSDISYLHVFWALCYQKNNREDIGKLGAKGDIGFFIGYSANSVAYRVYNRRTKKIMKMMNITFDELSAMAFEQNSSRPGLQSMTSRQISSELELTYAPSTITPQRPSERDLDILFELLHNEYLGGRQSEAPRAIPAASVLQNLQAPTTSMSFQDSAPVPSNSLIAPVSSHNVDATPQQHAQQQRNLTLSTTASAADNVLNAMFEGDLFVNPFDGIKPLTLKWLFKNKHDEENTVIRNKTRLVMRGYRQEEGVDFEESFALNGFSKGTIDLMLFTRRFDDDILVVQVYVDDIIFGSTYPRYATLFSDLMKSHFEMSMMGEMTFFLGLQVNQSPSAIFIIQSKYVHKILKKYGLNTCDIVGTPMDIKDKLDLDQIGTPVDATKYRSMIGALMYLTSSRPYIVHTACVCARYQAHPTKKHLKRVKRIFHYLQGTINMGLWYTKDSGFELTGFSDADYAGCKDTFKNTSGGA
nr:hypothetical protein [Tanacetum cinerariifolium]